MPAWHQRVSMSGRVEESEIVKNAGLHLYHSDYIGDNRDILICSLNEMNILTVHNWQNEKEYSLHVHDIKFTG